MSKKKGGDIGTSTIRTINQLLQDINIIYVECGGKSGEPAEDDSKLDDFQRAKKDLAETMAIIKKDLKTQKGIEERQGNNAEAIKLKQQVNKKLEEAKRQHAKLEEEYLRSQQRFDSSRV